MISTGCVRLTRALAIGALAVAGLSAGCGNVDAPVRNDQSDPRSDPPVEAFDARIAFTSTRDGERYIYVATADGSKVRRLTRGAKPAWSPDGQSIAFNRAEGDYSALRVIGVDGSGERLIATHAGISAWSPDGTKIVFGAVAPIGGLSVVNPDGSGLTELSGDYFEGSSGNWLSYPAWSPDGKRIAFMRANDYMWWPIYVMNADGSSPRLLETVGTLLEPSWSPDGTMLAVGSLNRTIGTINADGSGLILYPPPLAFDPDWSPDGRSLIFNAFASSVGDSVSQVGSRMRIYVIDRQTLAVRQLIPDAVAPKNSSYWDDEPAWLRSKP